MAESGKPFSAHQLTEMASALAAARTAYQEGNYQAALNSLQGYYTAQTSTATGDAYRGYATEALLVVENTGNGVVANNEVQFAMGTSWGLAIEPIWL